MRIICKSAFVFCGAMAVSALAHGGSITGTIVFEGKAPPMRPVIPDSADPHCVEMHEEDPVINEALVLGEGQTMGNIFVTVTKGLPDEEYEVPSEPFEVSQHGCRYDPHVFVMRVGQTLKVTNPDGIMHNVNGSPKNNPPFNNAMPPSVEEMEVVFSNAEPEPFALKCDIHPWMRSYCAVLEHPYYDVTEKDGKYEISDLPPGEYEIQAWHEKLPPITETVMVTDDKPAVVDFTFKR